MSVEDEFDDLLGDEVDEPITPPAGQKPNPVAEQRKQIRELAAKLKALEPEYEALKKFKEEADVAARETTISETFKELELPGNAVKFFKLENPEGEVTKEAVAKWAIDNEFATADQFTGTQEVDKGFTPTTPNDGVVVGSKTYTTEEALKLAKDDPALVARLQAQGKIKHERLSDLFPG